MKRAFACLLAAVCVGMALAQAPFTIVRPADGSKVREVVHVLFPRNSVPKGGYVGIFVNKKFIEAMVPPDDGKFLDYALDTKGLGLPEGDTTIEAVLYINFAERPRIVDRSSVQVSLSNKANIPVPSDGLTLRYSWPGGRAWVYDWDESVTLSTITETQAMLGGHAAQVPVDHYHARCNFEIDNVYPDGDALIRVQLEPPAGVDSFLLPISGDPTPRRLFETNMYPVYERLHRTGAETFGLIPSYWAMGGGAENAFDSSVNLIFPTSLPLLPVGRIKPGDSWFTRIQMQSPDDANRERVLEKNSLFDSLPARGEFLDVEWQMGYPCAKIRDTFSAGSGGPGLGREKIQTNAQSVEETYWFALDKGVVVRFERTETRDQLVSGQPTALAAGGQGDYSALNFGGVDFSPLLSLDSTTLPNYQFRGKPGGAARGFGALTGNNNGGNAPPPPANEQPQSQPELRRVTDTKVFTLIR